MKKKYSIVASLEYGRYFSKLCILYFYIFAILGLALIVGLIVAANVESMYSILFVLVLPLLGIPAAVYVIVRYHIMSSRIKLWVQDAVELNASSVEVGTYKYTVGINQVNKRKIQVSFLYNGHNIIMCSGKPNYEKQNGHNTKAGYEGIFRKFANRSIKILYSPKYRQVMILKDKD